MNEDIVEFDPLIHLPKGRGIAVLSEALRPKGSTDTPKEHYPGIGPVYRKEYNMNGLILTQNTNGVENGLCMDDIFLETISRLNQMDIKQYCKINSAVIDNGILQCIFTNSVGNGYEKREYDLIKLAKNWELLKDEPGPKNGAISGIIKNSAKGLYLVFANSQISMVIFNAGLDHLLIAPLVEINELLTIRLGKPLQHDVMGNVAPVVEALTARPTDNLLTHNGFQQLTNLPTYDHVVQSNPYRAELPHYGNQHKQHKKQRSMLAYDTYGITSIAVLNTVILFTFTDIHKQEMVIRLNHDFNTEGAIRTMLGSSFQSYAARVKNVKHYCGTTFDYFGAIYVFTKRGIAQFAVGTITNGDIIRSAYIPKDKVSRYVDTHLQSPRMTVIYKALD